MTLEEIEACIRLMERHGVPEFSLSRDGDTLTLHRAAALPPRPAAAPKLSTSTTIRAPAAGVFRGAHPADGERRIAENRAVQPGEIVAFLQVGPCLRPVAAAGAGALGAALVADGALVGFGAGLFEFRPGLVVRDE